MITLSDRYYLEKSALARANLILQPPENSLVKNYNKLMTNKRIVKNYTIITILQMINLNLFIQGRY